MRRNRAARRFPASILSVLLAFGTLGPAAAGGGEPLSPPLVYAHRGGADLFPENTLGAFAAAHDAWGDREVWIEMDAHLTADDDLVIIHDDTFDRTTDCTGPVLEKTAADAGACNAAVAWPGWGFEPVPTALQTLEQGREDGWRILFELKNIPTEHDFEPTCAAAAMRFLEVVEEAGFPRDRLAVQSFWPTCLDQVRLRDTGSPRIPIALLTVSQLPGAPPAIGFWAHQNALYSTIRDYEIVAPDQHSPDLSGETVASAQALGREVVIWTVNAAADIDRVISWGVDGIISDRPDLVYDAIDAP